MAAAHVPLGRRSFSLGDSHSGTPSKSNKNCDDLHLLSVGKSPGGARIVANRGPYSAKCRDRKH